VTPYYHLSTFKDKAILGPYTKASPNTLFWSVSFFKKTEKRAKIANFFENGRSLYNHAEPTVTN